MTLPPDYENPPRAPSRPVKLPSIPGWGFLIALGVTCVFASEELANPGLRDLGNQLSGAGLAILKYVVQKEENNA